MSLKGSHPSRQHQQELGDDVDDEEWQDHNRQMSLIGRAVCRELTISKVTENQMIMWRIQQWRGPWWVASEWCPEEFRITTGRSTSLIGRAVCKKSSISNVTGSQSTMWRIERWRDHDEWSQGEVLRNLGVADGQHLQHHNRTTNILIRGKCYIWNSVNSACKQIMYSSCISTFSVPFL